MKTVIGLFDHADEAKRAYTALVADGYAKADLDILTNDDKNDAPKLDKMRSWVPQPDLDIYLTGVHEGGTIITANVGDSAVERAASILGSFHMVNIADRAGALAKKALAPRATVAAAASAVGTAASPPKEVALTDAARNDNVLEVIEEDLVVGKEQVERGRMRIYNVVTEREVAQSVTLKDETVRVQRRPINRSVEIDHDLFKPRSFEMVEMDEIAQVKKTARVVEEVTLGKEVTDKIQTIKETLRRQDVQVEEIPAVRPFDSYDSDFRSFYTKQLANSGVSYESLTPAFRFGHGLATREPFRSSPWSAVEADARGIWEEKNPGTWDQNKAVVRYAWEAVRHTR
jgi:uncharacterized protein (TIGR02271 family)